MSAISAQQADQALELTSVVIPTEGGKNLLLPNVSVAEILPWRRIKPSDNGPVWCMGHFGWRGEVMPVVDFGGFAPNAEKRRKAARCLVVMNRARNMSGPMFYALAAEGLPRMLQLMDDDIKQVSGDLGPAEVMHVELGTEVVAIPNLSFIEDRVRDLADGLAR